jgi:hypothetical protein
MKKSFAFFTPATKEKAGEVVEREYESGPPQFLVQDGAARSSDEVQKELNGIVASLPKLKGGARSKADHQVRMLQRELRKALDIEESARRTQERRIERKQQQPTGNTTMAHVNSTVQADPFKAAVANLQKAAPAEFKAAVEQTRAAGKSVEQAVRNTLLK